MDKFLKQVIKILCIALAFFHLYTGLFGLLPCFRQRAVHVGIALIVLFLSHPAQKKKSIIFTHWYDFIFAILILISASYVFINHMKFMKGLIVSPSIFELMLAIITTVLILEAGRRVISGVFIFLVFFLLIYSVLGQYISGYWGHPPVSLSVFLQYMYLSANAIWGFLTGLSSNYLATFIIFGSILIATGGGDTFIDLACLLAGRMSGGPAKVAVISSAFFAMLSGNAPVNVITTGSFTIPMMKKIGYKPEFAGAVEAAASTGGILTPPVMGMAAFIMAELLAIPYLEVVRSAIIPAFLFYFGVLSGVHIEAKKNNLKPIPLEEINLIKKRISFSKIICLIIPIFALLFTLMKGYSLSFVGSTASITAVGTYIISDFKVNGIKEKILRLPDILEHSGKNIVNLVPMFVCANIIYFCLNFTGGDMKLAAIIMEVGQDNLILALILTGILLMILGCGMPSAPAYMLGAVVAGPLLLQLGILPISAHMFILYYSIISMITPPICPAIMVASHIAHSDWIKTAFITLKLAPALYFTPFLFIYNPEYLMIGSFILIVLKVLITAIAILMFSGSLMGYLISNLNIIERSLLMISSILMLSNDYKFNLFGLILCSLYIIIYFYKRNIKKTI